MYCPKCGKIIDDKSKFCTYCGETIVPIESKSTNNHSTTTKTSSINKNDKNKTKKDNFFTNLSTTRKCCYVFIILLILFAIVYIPYVIKYNENREDVSSFHQDEFDALDIDGNGYLTFDEAKEYGNKTPESKLLEFFNKSDHNGNNLLKGDEFDKFRYSVKDYEESLIKKIKQNNNSNYNSSMNHKSPPKSNSDYKSRTSPEYELWEEEEIVGYDEYGYPVYVCIYYTSGDKYFEPGVYTAIGNDYSGWTYEEENDEWWVMLK